MVFLAVGGATLAEEVDFAKLENQMWGYAKDKQWEKLKAGLAAGYQSADQHKTIGLKDALAALKKMNLSDFTLSDFKVTRTGPAAVVSYKAQVAETIDGKRIPMQKAPRTSVWVKTDKGWLTIFHASFNPLGK